MPAVDDEQRLATYRDYNLRRYYGIGIAEYDQMLAEQDGKCGICGTSECPTGRRLAVDHDHDTNTVRGLLCYRCNLFIALLEEDTSKTQRALAWLTREED